jgi:hypothetical protein
MTQKQKENKANVNAFLLGILGTIALFVALAFL